MGPDGLHVFGRLDADRFIRLLRKSGERWTSLASDAPMSRVFFMRHDEKFLRHVEWALATSQ
jgi:hypothetical protein